jgi:hypothetical protein
MSKILYLFILITNRINFLQMGRWGEYNESTYRVKGSPALSIRFTFIIMPLAPLSITKVYKVIYFLQFNIVFYRIFVK